MSLAYCLVSAFFGSVRMETSCVLGQFGERRHDRQPAHKFGNEAEIEQVLRFDVLQNFIAHPAGGGFSSPPIAPKPIVCRPSRRWMTFSRPDERPAANKQNVRRVHADVFLLRMFAPALGRNVADRAFQDFQSACCTPSPETSRVMDGPSALRAILSISSI